VILYRYKNHGKPWTQEHLEKLRVMLVEFELTPSQMSPHLGQDPRQSRSELMIMTSCQIQCGGKGLSGYSVHQYVILLFE
jgi:hypothetical protein